MYKSIFLIVLEGMKFLSVKQQRALKKKHHKILKKINDAINDRSDQYTDAAISMSEQELETFLKAYHEAFKQAGI